MNFVVKETRQKNPASYKSLYIKDSLLKEVNNVVISMIEACIYSSGEGQDSLKVFTNSRKKLHPVVF